MLCSIISYTLISHGLILFILFLLLLYLQLQIQIIDADNNVDGLEPQHPNHKNGEETIDVSSSIGVSHDGDHSGVIEDLVANESNGEPVKVAPGGPAHASVVDSDTDLMSAESDQKFSLTKFKRPVIFSN